MISPSVVSEQQRRQFVDEGWFLLESVIPQEHLELLRAELQSGIEAVDRHMDELGTDVWDISHRGRRYFIGNVHQTQPRVNEFLFSDLMADVCRATLGGDVWHFFNQYVVKAAEVGMTFEWHQDSGYVAKVKSTPHLPYLSCWCTLDDVDEDNGTVYLLPFSRAGSREVADHRRLAGSNDLLGYFGDDPGVPVIAPAGSIAVFSSVLFHRSGPNRTGAPRRVYLAQYSAEPLMQDDPPDLPVQNADPFLRDGRRVVAVPG
ncbi:MAG TPA: phytanoyl-CoA dioxygenase family protein [Candidatus Dormibacteraeota bacterium]|nr:phytanoyl-CoA dioxygenase family protein [Candidatus Dormibacteraeota bacterium]